MLFDYSKVLFVSPRGDKMSDDVYLTIGGDGVINLEISDHGIAKPNLPIDILYIELLTLQSVAMLTPEQKYRITNFQSVYTLPNKVTGVSDEINFGPVEPLIVTALTASLLETRAFSEPFPFDVIRYELIWADFIDSIAPVGAKGRITYRESKKEKIISYHCT